MSSEQPLVSPAQDINGQIYIGSILLELNRWGQPKVPNYNVSEWLERFKEAGFDGIELWEYHATMCEPEELDALKAPPIPIAIFSTYCDFDDGSESDRRTAAQLVPRLPAGGVKYNVGKDPALRDAYLTNLRDWIDDLPDDCRILCECHGGTVIEEPALAKAFFDELGEDRCEIILHSFAPDLARLREWFSLFGPRVTHTHVQVRDADGNMVQVGSNAAHVKECLRIMQGEGYAGSFTLEFTEGTRQPDENMDDLWTAALADLEFLRGSIA